MSTNNILSKIRQEIEKRMHICDGIFERDSETYYQGKAVAYQETLSLIDSLQQEQPSEDLENAAIDYADYARKQFKDYAISSVADYDHGCIDGFKAGAEWQKSKMPMPEDTVIFQKGIEEGKRLMMEDAVEGYVNYYEDGGGKLMAEAQVGCPYHIGDKVKIIIVKEDSK